MKVTLSREALLGPLQMACGVVERRKTLPILSNVLIQAKDNSLSITGTDLEVELVGRSALEHIEEPGAVTVPGRKLLDICRNLPEQAEVKFSVDNQKVKLQCGRGRYTLTTMPAEEYPNVESSAALIEFNIQQQDLKALLEATQFAMAQQDVRFYLNGMLWDVSSGRFTCVATDGHRLAFSQKAVNVGDVPQTQVVVPRKGVMELTRLLEAEEEVTVSIGKNHIHITGASLTFTSKLIEGQYPDYKKVLPKHTNKQVIAKKDVLKQTLNRVSILSNERFKGVRADFGKNLLTLTATNPEHEEAEEEVEVNYTDEPMTIGFNVSYLIDALNAISGDEVLLTLNNPGVGILVEEVTDAESLYLVMPMRL